MQTKLKFNKLSINDYSGPSHTATSLTSISDLAILLPSSPSRPSLIPEVIRNSAILPPSFTDIEYHSSTVIHESSNKNFCSFLIYFFYQNIISR